MTDWFQSRWIRFWWHESVCGVVTLLKFASVFHGSFFVGECCRWKCLEACRRHVMCNQTDQLLSAGCCSRSSARSSPLWVDCSLLSGWICIEKIFPTLPARSNKKFCASSVTFNLYFSWEIMLFWSFVPSSLIMCERRRTSLQLIPAQLCSSHPNSLHGEKEYVR